MTTADKKVDQAAEKVQELHEQMSREGGMQAKVAEQFADDAAFIRKLKPSLIKARIKGEAPRNQTPAAPSGPQLGSQPKKKKSSGGGPSPWIIVGVALAAGVLAAKWIDWRGHAHPRD